MEINQTLDLKRDTILDRITLVLTTVMFTLLIVLVTVQTFFRVMDIPFTATWTEPIARFLFIVGSYFGAAVASRNLEHVRLTLIRERFLARRKYAQAALDIVTCLGMLLFITIAMWSLYNATVQGWDTQALGGFDALRAGHIYLGMLLGFLCMGIFELQNLVGTIRDLVSASSVQELFEGITSSDESPEEQ